VGEKVCSQLNREIGEFCGRVGDSVAIATGRAVALLKGRSNWADASLRYHITWKLLSRNDTRSGTRWSDDGRHVNVVVGGGCPIAEIAAPLRQRRDRQSRNAGTASLVIRLPIEVEKALVLAPIDPGKLDWPADVGAEVVLVVGRCRRRAPLGGVQRFIAAVFENCAVISIAARLADHRDLPRGRRAVLCVVTRCNDFDFLDHVRRHLEVLMNRNHAALAHEAFLHGRAVEKGFIPRFLAAVDPGLKRLVRAAG
jgi:hypothetical protein